MNKDEYIEKLEGTLDLQQVAFSELHEGLEVLVTLTDNANQHADAKEGRDWRKGQMQCLERLQKIVSHHALENPIVRGDETDEGWEEWNQRCRDAEYENKDLYG
jgi:hypothetical protein